MNAVGNVTLSMLAGSIPGLRPVTPVAPVPASPLQSPAEQAFQLPDRYAPSALSPELPKVTYSPFRS